MATLNRAVALAEMDDVVVVVREHLHLDVARILEVALDVDGRIGEVSLALASGRLERALDLRRIAYDLQTFAPTSSGCLDRDRPAKLVAEAVDLFG